MALKLKEAPRWISTIIAEKAEDGTFEIIDGHNRYRAAENLGGKPYIARELGEGLVEIGMLMPALA